jgi:hypothetical protein
LNPAVEAVLRAQNNFSPGAIFKAVLLVPYKIGGNVTLMGAGRAEVFELAAIAV